MLHPSLPKKKATKQNKLLQTKSDENYKSKKQKSRQAVKSYNIWYISKEATLYHINQTKHSLSTETKKTNPKHPFYKMQSTTTISPTNIPHIL